MTNEQRESLMRLCKGYGVNFEVTAATLVHSPFDLPAGYVAGWIGTHIYVGIDPDGSVSS